MKLQQLSFTLKILRFELFLNSCIIVGDYRDKNIHTNDYQNVRTYQVDYLTWERLRNI